jgi:hypothetical protein
MIEDESLEEIIHPFANSPLDTYIRSLMQGCRAVVCVEEIDAKA